MLSAWGLGYPTKLLGHGSCWVWTTPEVVCIMESEREDKIFATVY